jgi:hypothetical protein
VLNDWRSKASNLFPVIPEIDIWRAANLMLKRYGDKAAEESAARADELAAQDDYKGEKLWERRGGLAPSSSREDDEGVPWPR